MSFGKLLRKKASSNNSTRKDRGLKIFANKTRVPIKAKRQAFTGNPHTYSNKLTYEELINAESALGKTIFGPIPEGHQREFFEYRKNVWIWHESFVDPAGVMQNMTVRYEVRPDGVFKRPNNGNYRKIEGVELENFRRAASIYLNLIKTKLYR